MPYSRISPNLRRAVLVAEDSAFWDHEGIDAEQIRKSVQDSLTRRQAPRGASTITQQLAKNLYLSPSYDPLRKIKELIIARRSKSRCPRRVSSSSISMSSSGAIGCGVPRPRLAPTSVFRLPDSLGSNRRSSRAPSSILDF